MDSVYTTLPEYGLFKFNVTAVDNAAQAIKSIKLRVYQTDATVDAPGVYKITGSWVSEGTVTWNNQPAHDSTALVNPSGSTGSANTWYEYTIPTSTITGDGEYDFMLIPDSSNAMAVDAHEKPLANTAQLVITMSYWPVRDGTSEYFLATAGDVACNDTSSVMTVTDCNGELTGKLIKQVLRPDKLLTLGDLQYERLGEESGGAWEDNSDDNATDGIGIETLTGWKKSDWSTSTQYIVPGRTHDFYGSGYFCDDTNDVTSTDYAGLYDAYFPNGCNKPYKAEFGDWRLMVGMSYCDKAGKSSDNGDYYTGGPSPSVNEQDLNGNGIQDAGESAFVYTDDNYPNSPFWQDMWKVPSYLGGGTDCDNTGSQDQYDDFDGWFTNATTGARVEGDCTILAFHESRWSSAQAGASGSTPRLDPILKNLLNSGSNGPDIILGGHSHFYERFDSQYWNGTNYSVPTAPTEGVRAFVIGSGGKNLQNLGSAAPNSLVRNDTKYGVGLFALRSGKYDFYMVPTDGSNLLDISSMMDSLTGVPCNN